MIYYYRKKKGVFSRIFRHHAVVAWTVVVALTILFWRTRTSLLSQVAQLKQFSTASESETFLKISKLNENIAAKNKEVAELNKMQRSLHKSIKVCEEEKASLIHDRESATMKVERLAIESSDLRKQAEKYRQECHEVVQAKDTAHLEKDARIQQLQDEINAIYEKLRTTEEHNALKSTSEPMKVEGRVKHGEQDKKLGTKTTVGGEQENATNEGSDNLVDNHGSVRVTEDVKHPEGPSKLDETLKQGRKGRKKNLGMLKEHMGVGKDDY